MALSLLRGWREERGREERARSYVKTLMADPDADVVSTLATTGDRDEDHAKWELRYARRAIGVLVAERDALDDLTSSDVVAALGTAIRTDPNVAADRREIADRQINDRLRGYRAALTDRTGDGSTSARLGRVLLAFAGATSPDVTGIAFAANVAGTMVVECNTALREAYGEASLPADLAPSTIPKSRS